MTTTTALPKELRIIAEAELNEVSGRVEEDLAHIRSWLSKQPHIKSRSDDLTLLIFLRSCKFSLEKTKKKLEIFYTIKSSLPVFKNRDPFSSKIQLILQNNLSAVSHIPNKPLLIMVRVDNVDPNIITMYDALKMGLMMFEVLVREYAETSIVGQALLIDFKNIPLKYVTQLTPTFLKTFVTCFVSAYPTRIKVLHFINLPSIFHSPYHMMFSFLPKKLQERATLHALHEQNNIQHYIPSLILPKEYGGEAGSFQDLSAKLRTQFENYAEWFQDDEQYVCIEEKRPVASKLEVDLFSIDGSFRKLDID